uniref:Thiaminase-2/PQQC domain-containing protein n=1 Tax=Chromera velia CCMP2878 TaxID=1169474 RepID=A0A0G4H9A5_9ALVE|eukprot:Cvel_25257.t1-p1 / transcript=Cvel_25257.t1 / gene=Cvel_25257 / organism=Chromera_velia_CCMP2878 / gene_product=hypothetical protein / transcript_product=hypothetical protein / location=Cvel_scaffold2834:21446-21964(-) / protein_length=173 / sequence_SO=supercontig / SO=protein_coding / is_pseudo=false
MLVRRFLGLVSVMPCQRLYEYTGKALKSQQTEESLKDHPYGWWIEEYASKENEHLSLVMEAHMEAGLQSADEWEKEEAVHVYRQGLFYEWLFWLQSWHKWPAPDELLSPPSVDLSTQGFEEARSTDNSEEMPRNEVAQVDSESQTETATGRAWSDKTEGAEGDGGLELSLQWS